MNATLTSTFLALSLVVSAGVVTGAPTTELDGQPTTGTTLDASASPGFGTGVVDIGRNGTAAIPLVLDSASEATVSIGDEEEGYTLVADVTDDGDGRVVLLFDTSKAGRDGATIRTANREDGAVVQSETELSKPPLDAGSYSLSLQNSTGEEVAVASLVVRQTDVSAGFEVDEITAERGETATIRTSLTGTDAATVKLGPRSTNYELVVTAVDLDGDGAVTISLATDAIAEEGSPVFVDESHSSADVVRVQSEFAGFEGDRTLAPGHYSLSAFLGNTTPDDATVDTAMLEVMKTEPETTRTTTETTQSMRSTTDLTTRATTDKPMRSTTETETTTVSDPEPGVPGFGPGIGVVALAAAALLATRR